MMKITVDHHHYHHTDPDTAERLRRIERLLSDNTETLEIVMIDTSKMLAAVAAERTELASWKELSAQQTKAIVDAAQALKDATAAQDPAALAAVQADLDKAATDLSADNADAATAIAANITPAVPATPAAPPITL
jgi:ABC-type transporter Mla subunit MlaD